MNLFINWLAMNGYARYIWPAYGLVFGILTLNLIYTKRHIKNAHRRLQQWFNQ